MIHRHCLVLALGLSWCLAMSTASAQTAIPAAARTVASVDAATAGLIDKFVAENVARLSDRNPDVVRQAREALIEAARAGSADASPAYAARYADAVAAQVLVILDREKAVRPRLNAAVVAARVADLTRSGRLEPVALRLLADDQPEALKLWGAKTARSTIPDLVRTNAHQKLLDRLIAVWKANPTGPLTEELYSALTRDDSKQVVAALINPLLNVARERAEQYRKNPLPDAPDSDSAPVMFLTRSGVWDAALTDKQRRDAMQVICDLLVLAAQRGDQADIRTRELFVQTVNRMLQGVAVAAMVMKENNLYQVAASSARAASNPGARLTPLVTPVLNEVRKLKDFASITVTSAGATPAP